jgi:hypothetical protein
VAYVAYAVEGTGDRRELLDHIIAVNERHLRRLLFDYVRYHPTDRISQGWVSVELGEDVGGREGIRTFPLRSIPTTMGGNCRSKIEA